MHLIKLIEHFLIFYYLLFVLVEPILLHSFMLVFCLWVFCRFCYRLVITTLLWMLGLIRFIINLVATPVHICFSRLRSLLASLFFTSGLAFILYTYSSPLEHRWSAYKIMSTSAFTCCISTSESFSFNSLTLTSAF